MAVAAGPIPAALASPAATPGIAGRRAPSPVSKMICSPEVRAEISAVLTVTLKRAARPTWVDQVYACRYPSRSGTLTLSVKELPDATTSSTYVEDLGVALGRRPDLIRLGDEAFVATDGSVVVSKDNKVLVVDVSRLDPDIGTQHRAPADAALSVASVILGCWTGDAPTEGASPSRR
jgi:hypothetical protein